MYIYIYIVFGDDDNDENDDDDGDDDDIDDDIYPIRYYIWTLYNIHWYEHIYIYQSHIRVSASIYLRIWYSLFERSMGICINHMSIYVVSFLTHICIYIYHLKHTRIYMNIYILYITQFNMYIYIYIYTLFKYEVMQSHTSKHACNNRHDIYILYSH